MRIRIALVLFLLFAFAQTSAGAEEQVVVRIGYINVATSLPLFIAEEKGWFEEAGIKAEITVAASADQLVTDMHGGHLDVYVNSSVLPLMAASLVSPGKAKIILVHPWYKDPAWESILVRADGDIKSLKDLEGKKVGNFPASNIEKVLAYSLERQGVDVSRISFVPVPGQAQIQALLGGSVDAVHVFEPSVTIGLHTGKVRVLHPSPFADIMNPITPGHGAISSAFLKDQPETAAKVVEILVRGVRYGREHQDESRAIIARKLGLDPAIAQDMTFVPTWVADEIDAARLQAYADLMLHLGFLSRRVDVNNLIYKGADP